jgi:hypothetical protein
VDHWITLSELVSTHPLGHGACSEVCSAIKPGLSFKCLPVCTPLLEPSHAFLRLHLEPFPTLADFLHPRLCRSCALRPPSDPHRLLLSAVPFRSRAVSWSSGLLPCREIIWSRSLPFKPFLALLSLLCFYIGTIHNAASRRKLDRRESSTVHPGLSTPAKPPLTFNCDRVFVASPLSWSCAAICVPLLCRGFTLPLTILRHRRASSNSLTSALL